MLDKCPGRNLNKISSEEITCSACGYAVEIFTDEVRVRCAGCSKYIFREKLPSCLDWCKAAEKCIGEEKFKQLKVCLSAGKGGG
ncbi:MAG: phosphohydrolase [Candidatus Omnitrophota bacterium]